ncbi:MAG: gamma-glutamyl-gamma-aminobutyrate hydrolase family protein [Micrococcales bacterium]|nr:gamma-glutamyl-gamma-aminobutyrate hydrolase family protein [Micrococcales bacterium]
MLVSLNFPQMTIHTAELVTRFTRTALQTLVNLGASYEVFDTSTALRDARRVAEADALLILGGGDVSATLYGGSDEGVPNSYGVDARADHDTIDGLNSAVAADRPVLAICRGSQLVNVAHGGSCIPDIADFGLHRGGPGEPMFLDEEVNIVPGTRLHSILGRDRVTVRSGHHQAVDRVGEGLRVAAKAHDGIVEAVEHPDRWLIGVQWHPEDDHGCDDHRGTVFAAFVDAAAGARG